LLNKVFGCGGWMYLMAVTLGSGVGVRKVDAQGCLILPADWCELEIGASKELFIIKRKSHLKLIPKRRIVVPLSPKNL
jgi:hypothetical protein